MNKVIKGGGIALGIFLILIIGAVILAPMLVDVQKYRPDIEALVTKQTGRPFSMGDDIELSVFPWVGVSLSDLKLGNGPGFNGADMITVKGFEVRLKVLPLLSRRVEVDTFVMDSPRILLVKNKAGKANWENIGPAGAKKQAAKAAPAEPADPSKGGLPIESLMVGRFSIINGFLSYLDQGAGIQKEVADLNLELQEISLDRPIKIDLSASLDKKPLSLSGRAGPLGKDPGKADLGLDLVVKALGELEVGIKGTLAAPLADPHLDMSIMVSPFSPRKLFKSLGQPFPVETKDPKVLDRVSLKAGIKGGAKEILISNGVLELDDSTLNFSAGAKAFEKPDLQFDLSLDKMDLDRYLPPAREGDAAPAAPGSKPGAKPDYALLRKMVLDGKARIASLKAANLRMENILVHLTGKNGVFTLDPFSMDLYQGKAGAKARVDLSKNTPLTNISVNTQGVQAGPLIKDGAQKEIIEGTLAADLGLSMAGDTPAQVKESLGGKGTLTFTDGAIVGIDIAGTIRNAKSGLGLGAKTAEKPRTDFAELKIPYTADRGLVNIPGASLASPLLRLGAAGKTHLVKEDLDFRIEPKLVATLKGQGDTKDRSGLLIPLKVTGTWASPKIRPDLKAVVEGELTKKGGLKNLIEGKDGQKPEDKAKGLIKGLFN